jgi:hypothetical protein
LSLQASGLRLKETKSEFLKTEIKYFSKNGITPNNKNIPSILKYPEFKPQTELEYFFSLARNYQKFVLSFAEKLIR